MGRWFSYLEVVHKKITLLWNSLISWFLENSHFIFHAAKCILLYTWIMVFFINHISDDVSRSERFKGNPWLFGPWRQFTAWPMRPSGLWRLPADRLCSLTRPRLSPSTEAFTQCLAGIKLFPTSGLDVSVYVFPSLRTLFPLFYLSDLYAFFISQSTVKFSKRFSLVPSTKPRNKSSLPVTLCHNTLSFYLHMW